VAWSESSAGLLSFVESHPDAGRHEDLFQS
jgi:hypothetical protein